MPIRLNHGEFSKPTLRVKSPAEKALDSAEFECEFEMARLRFQVYLIYRPKSNETYRIITRENSINLEHSYKNIGKNVSVTLIWPYFPAEAADIGIYCVVDYPGQLEGDNLDELPIFTSAPVYHNLSSICPMRPIIERVNLSPDTDIAEGSRVTFVCEAVTGNDHMHALQMSYSDLKENLIICSNRGGGKVNSTVPCMFSPWNTGGCRGLEKVLTDSHPKGAFASCSISYRETVDAYIRRIEYTIPMLSIQHFESFIFCETLPTWEVEEENRFLSDPIDNYFPVGPRVTDIDLGYYEWICEAAAYPEPINVSWVPIEATPEKFADGLRKIAFFKKLTRSTRYHAYDNSPAGYFPKKFRLEDRASRYRFQLVRPVPYVYQVGIWGEAKFACYIVSPDNKTAYEEAHISYGYGKSDGHWTVSGSIEPSTGVINPDETWRVLCPLQEIEGGWHLTHLYLLAQIQSPSIQPLEIPLLYLVINRTSSSSVILGNVTTLGWWAYTRGKEFQVSMSTGHQTSQVVKIDFPKASVSFIN